MLQFGQKDEQNLEDFGKTTLGFIFLGALIGLLCALLWAFGKENFGPALILCTAALWAGCLLGFLFGIPKSSAHQQIQASGAVTKPSVGSGQGRTENRYRPNTNLEEVSDWLTKMIVGLGLVSLSKAPAALTELGNKAAGAFGEHKPSGSMVLAALFAFSIFGFISGYLVTLIFISVEIRKAGKNLERDNDQIADRAVREAEATVSNAPAPDSATTKDLDLAKNALLAQAKEYLAISGPDLQKRTRAKTAAAAAMGKLINAASISRDELANIRDEGVYVALANAIVQQPQEGDAARLIQFAEHANRLHVQYSIVVAYLALLDRGLVSALQMQLFLPILTFYYQRADESLKTIIEVARRRSAV